MSPGPLLSDRFVRAAEYAAELHRDQRRKGTAVPYIAHLLGVASLVLEDGGSEDEAIGALLHDAVEDCGGAPILEEITRRFGSNVAGIVDGCSDTDEQPKPQWRERKEAYIAHLPDASPEVIRVSLADKLYNARAIVRDLVQEGLAALERFDPTSDQAWYYRQLVQVYAAKSTSPMVAELEREVGEIERLVSSSASQSTAERRAGSADLRPGDSAKSQTTP